ncbi:MAG: phosphatase PAP2 family protein [Terriglobales bacterium]
MAAFASAVGANSHYFVTCLLLLMVLPAFKAAGLHLSVSWGRLIPLYWVGFAAHSVLAAVILAIIGLPSKITVRPVLARFAAQKGRLVIFVPFVLWAFWKFGVYLGLLWISIALVSTEIYDRSEGNLRKIARPFGSVMLPAMYLFGGLVLVFAYNDFIAAVKDLGGYDWFFLRADSYLLHGGTVSDLVRDASLNLSPRIFAFAETMYYRMFDQVGAAIILVTLCQGKKRGLQFVGTMLTAYYMALVIFYFWPSMGPFYTCQDHFIHFPHWLKTYDFQRTFMANAKFMSSRYKSMGRVGSDYFIAFPSLHIALTIIVLWFMRRWKRIVLCLVVYDIILIPAILLLEWHYIIDLLGGVGVALIAIFINHFPDERSKQDQSGARLSTDVLKTEPSLSL